MNPLLESGDPNRASAELPGACRIEFDAVSTRLENIAQRLAQRTPSEIDLPVSDQAAVAVILAARQEDSALELLLIQRSERSDDPWSGHMALPGGRRDESDVDLCDTALREAREETGISLERATLLGRLDDLRPMRRSLRSLSVRPFVFRSALRPALTLSDEVADALWVPLSSLRETATTTSVLHRGEELRVPAFLVGTRVVWGMTQRVLAGLFELE